MKSANHDGIVGALLIGAGLWIMHGAGPALFVLGAILMCAHIVSAIIGYLRVDK